MKTKKMLLIGIENFEDMHSREYYYVDKTGFISGLLENGSTVNLFTRPRRFGKSLNMSMLKYFFGYGCDPALFEGLEITREALNFRFLAESDRLSEQEKEKYRGLIKVGPVGFTMTDEMETDGLRLLSELLYKHYWQKAILLIDEYDVPLDKAQHYGYYDQMLSLIRRLLGQALKSNNSLFCAVLACIQGKYFHRAEQSECSDHRKQGIQRMLWLHGWRSQGDVGLLWV